MQSLKAMALLLTSCLLVWSSYIVYTNAFTDLILSDIDLSGNEEFIVQEFIEDAALVFDRRFDIGIYVLITSVAPLRIYMYDDWRVKWVITSIIILFLFTVHILQNAPIFAHIMRFCLYWMLALNE